MVSLDAKLLLVLVTLLATAKFQTPPQSILVSTTISAGQPLNVFCDPYRVIFDLTTVNFISSISILRKTSADTIESTIAVYTIFGPNPDQTISTIPQNRNWTVITSGNGTKGDMNSVKLAWTLYDTKCEDAGTYRCDVTFATKPNNRLLDGTNSMNLTVTAAISVPIISVNPSSVTGDMMYNDGENLNLTCSVQAPNSVKIKWELWAIAFDSADSVPVLTSLPPAVPGPTQATPTGGCTQNTQTSTLENTISNAQEEYKCIVTDVNGNVYTGNITLSATTPTPNKDQSKSDSADVGMIVGIVIGCVVLIGIIITVIFFVRYRQRSKERTYKDNHDQPDVGTDNSLHAPPPVFYPTAKPGKGNKEDKDYKAPAGITNEGLNNSYDSRDSNLKMPPRYTNTEIDTNGPPRYEKETHRGRSNKGYDDDQNDRDRNGTRSHKQPREPREPRVPREHRDQEPHEQTERKHRSRHDGESRNRKYSPDDGTVNFDNYGDAGMGTSI